MNYNDPQNQPTLLDGRNIAESEGDIPSRRLEWLKALDNKPYFKKWRNNHYSLIQRFENNEL